MGLNLASIFATVMTAMMVNSGHKRKERKGKRAKKPLPRWMRKFSNYVGIMAKLFLAVLVLYLFWLIYIAAYEHFYLT